MKRKSDRQTNTNSHHTQQKHITQNNKHLFLRQFACNAMQRRENKKKNKKRKTITTTLMINEQIIENETGTNEDRTAVIRWRLAHGMYCLRYWRIGKCERAENVLAGSTTSAALMHGWYANG